MKIGILTLPLHSNYGGILQAYALQKYLLNEGHEVKLLDKSPYVKEPNILRLPYVLFIRFIKKFILRKDVIFLTERYYNTTYDIVNKELTRFIHQYINRVEVDNLSSLKSTDFEALIVGSDQIWRPSYYPNIEDAYFKFAENWNVKRISYAPSFGKDSWEYSDLQSNNCKKLISKFDFVSVREDSAAILCEKFLGISAVHVLDPTMLLSAEHYRDLFRTSSSEKSKGDLLNYILDSSEDISDFIENLSADLNLTPFRVNSVSESLFASLEERTKPSIEVWLRGFDESKFIVTDSFHACVFSIIFNKPFIVIANKERGYARFSSLLKQFDLEDRIMYESLEYNSIIKNQIDWDIVNNKLETLSRKSKDFLLEWLKSSK